LTDDCSGPAAAWCWIYANYTVDNGASSGAEYSQYTYLRKFLGAIPVTSNSAFNYTFTEQNCIDITSRGNGTLYNQGQYSLTSLTNYQPNMLPLSFNDEIGPPYKVSTWRFSSVVKDSIPSNLVQPSVCANNSNAYFDATGYLDYYVNTQTTPGTSVTYNVDFSQFYPRIVSGTAPALCESIFTVSTFNIYNATLVGSTTGIVGVSVTSQTAQLQPVQYYECYGNVGPPVAGDNFMVFDGLTQTGGAGCPPPAPGSTVTFYTGFVNSTPSVTQYVASSELRLGSFQNILVGSNWLTSDTSNVNNVTLSCVVDGYPTLDNLDPATFPEASFCYNNFPPTQYPMKISYYT
jgi:hypothetical protein